MATTMTKPPTTKLLTATDLLRLAGEGVRGELIRGVLHETMIIGTEARQDRHGTGLLVEFFHHPRKLGTLTGADAGVWLERDPDTVRAPDIAYFSAETMPPAAVPDYGSLARARARREWLIRGSCCTKRMIMGQRHGKIVMKLGFELLNSLIIPRKLGTLTGADAGVWLERDPDTVRGPDLAYFSAATMPPAAVPDGYAEVVPDLVVEVVSPNDTRREVAAKARMWLRYDVRLVWVVLPQTRSVDVYRPGHAVETLTDQDTLDGLDVLPGFTCPVSAVFDTCRCLVLADSLPCSAGEG